MVKTIEWTEEGIRMIDQRKLPYQREYFLAKDHYDIAKAIKDMIIRGAPAIGVAAAMGIALAMKNLPANSKNKEEIQRYFEEVCLVLQQTRPTAVNLSWAIEQMRKTFYKNIENEPEILKRIVYEEAIKIYRKDIEVNEKIGKIGSIFIKEGYGILTHCNAGALATAGYGTALGIIRYAHKQGKNFTVYVDETRPYLQGARLTAWELLEENIRTYLITDNMAGFLMKLGKINCVIVGADRIAANGDTANKIGTYSLAILARYHKIPFYVAAPSSTIDMKIESGSKIPIEWRNQEEVKNLNNIPIAPKEIEALNPAFDITPSHLISAFITEIKIVKKPYEKNLNKLFSAKV